jgi:hypothetical protein
MKFEREMLLRVIDGSKTQTRRRRDKGHYPDALVLLRGGYLIRIKRVKIELLQDISWDDAISEGLERSNNMYPSFRGAHCLEWRTSPVDAFLDLWESIYGKGSAEHNPIVWVYEFERVER